MKNYKILFADLDGTLIKTKSGETFPKGIWDMEFWFEVLDAIKKMQPEYVFIVSNQGGIEKGLVNDFYFDKKFSFIVSAIEEYCGGYVRGNYCVYNDKEFIYRKPNIGMLNKLCNDYIEPTKEPISKDSCLMIGNVSGKERQWPDDTDKKTAENFGCDYMDVEDFVKFVNAEGYGVYCSKTMLEEEYPIPPNKWRYIYSGGYRF